MSIFAQSTDIDAEHGDAHFGHMFDPWLTCSHSFVTVLGDNIATHWTHFIDPLRERKLREVDRQNRDAVLRAILANLAFGIASGFDPPSIGISIRAAKQKGSRYERPGFRTLPKVAELLSTPEGGSYLDLDRSHRKGVASSLTVNPSLAADLRRFKFAPKHFGLARARETIILSSVKRDFAGNVESRELLEYEDTEITARFRAEMVTINDFLETARLDFEDDGGAPVMTNRRYLTRYFRPPPEGKPNFNLAGRLFGGWWDNLAKTRRHAIRIGGEPVADLDFASMFLRLAYIDLGLAPPNGDLYASVPGLSQPHWRPGVKAVANAMLSRSTKLTRVPRNTRELLPTNISGPEVRNAMLAAHPALEPIFETGAGLRLMFTESQILVAALLALVQAKIAFMPMHDGLMVARSRADKAARIMDDAAKRVTGHRLPISLKSQY